MRLPPLLRNKFYRRPVFTPENLLREARRQRGIAKGKVPEICVLDPGGDLVRHLRKTGAAKLSAAWACYHTELYEFEAGGARVGVLGCAVGSSFATARRRRVLCLAHVTNCMAQTEGDFEKGEAEGSVAVMGLLGWIGREWGKKRR